MVRPLDGHKQCMVALAALVAAVAVTAISQVSFSVRAGMVAGIGLAVIADWRQWIRGPCRATWRPRRGWMLDWTDGRQQGASLRSASRVWRRCLVLEWAVADGSRARMLVTASGCSPETMRRIRVLMRMGRGDG